MWFKMPKGAGTLTVERQAFVAEVTDSAGIGYFRAPDHFAPRILDLPGFVASDPPEDLNPPADDTKQKGQVDKAIGELTQQLQMVKSENKTLREDAVANNAKHNALTLDFSAMGKRAELAEATLAKLKEDLADKGVEIADDGKITVPPAGKTK